MTIVNLTSFDASLKALYPETRIQELAKRVPQQRPPADLDAALDWIAERWNHSLTDIEVEAEILARDRGLDVGETLERLYGRPIMAEYGYAEPGA